MCNYVCIYIYILKALIFFSNNLPKNASLQSLVAIAVVSTGSEHLYKCIERPQAISGTAIPILWRAQPCESEATAPSLLRSIGLSFQ